MLVEFGRASWWRKMQLQPERTRLLWQKVQADGLWSTWRAVRSKLAEPLPLGYCHVGRVIATGNVEGYQLGDRVVSNSPHAEVVLAHPATTALIPEGVSDESATFTPLAAIALQGIRLMDVQSGDRIVVMGLGLIGQLAVQVLCAQGCEVLGLDPDETKCALAAKSGATTLANQRSEGRESAVMAWTKGMGAAGVLITASTASDEPVNFAARCCRRQGRVVLIGVTGLKLNRADYYAREVSFQVSNSYGVRELGVPFSAQENFKTVLAWMAEGKINPSMLVSERFNFAQATSAYQRISTPATYGLMLNYNASVKVEHTVSLKPSAPSSGVGISLIGAGNFASRTLLPALVAQSEPFTLRRVVSAQGLHAQCVAERFSALEACTDYRSALEDAKTDAVIIATQHDLHATLAIAALQAGKSVWVEKPLALTEADLNQVMQVAAHAPGKLMVGFNRRFAPLARIAQQHIRERSGPKRYTYTINAGTLPVDHWALDPRRGGGRIVGEAIHFLDLVRSWVGHACVKAEVLERGQDGQDAGRFLLSYADGSTAHINYLTDLPASVPKENILVEGADWSLTIDHWSRLTTSYGFMAGSSWFKGPDKGHREAMTNFLLVSRGEAPVEIPLDELAETSRWAIQLQATR
jgi:predicted dehydrogenase/threonine dehydrogenase-like Zn-dependent dehydrogenase